MDWRCHHGCSVGSFSEMDFVSEKSCQTFGSSCRPAQQGNGNLRQHQADRFWCWKQCRRRNFPGRRDGRKCLLSNSVADLVKAKNEALGIEAKGAAEALAKEKLGQAEVAPQITLAHEIGNNQGYQTYLIEIKKVDALQAVGIEQAKNLGNADIKIIANAGSNVQEGVSSVMQLFSAKGGQAMNSMLEAFAGTELGQQLLGKICNAGNDAADKPITGASSNAGVQKPEADNKGKKK